MDKQTVINRINDWKQRLENLNALICKVAENTPDCKVLPDKIPQRVEPLMQNFGVEPIELPTVAVIRGKMRTSFVPSALWVVGANGRVNVTTNRQQYILLDTGGYSDNPSDWKILTSDLSLDYLPFDEEMIRSLITTGDIPVFHG